MNSISFSSQQIGNLTINYAGENKLRVTQKIPVSLLEKFFRILQIALLCIPALIFDPLRPYYRRIVRTLSNEFEATVNTEFQILEGDLKQKEKVVDLLQQNSQAIDTFFREQFLNSYQHHYIELLHPRFKDNKDFALQLIEKWGSAAYRRLSDSLKIDEDVAFKSVSKDVTTLMDAPPALIDNYQFMLKAYKHFWLAITYATPNLLINPNFIKEAVEYHGAAFSYCNPTLRDKTLLMLALETYPFALREASNVLKADDEVVNKALEKNGKTLQFADEKYKKCPIWARKAVRSHGRALEFVDPDLIDRDRELVMEALIRNPRAYKSARDHRNDPEIIDFVLRKDPRTLASMIPMDFFDKPFLLEVMQKIPFEYFLGYAKDYVMHDPELMLFGIVQNESLFQFAGLALKNDRDFILQAVKKNGLVLKYVAPEKKDREIILAAIKENPKAIAFVPERFTDLPEMTPETPNERVNGYSSTALLPSPDVRGILADYSFDYNLSFIKGEHIRNKVPFGKEKDFYIDYAKVMEVFQTLKWLLDEEHLKQRVGQIISTKFVIRHRKKFKDDVEFKLDEKDLENQKREGIYDSHKACIQFVKDLKVNVLPQKTIHIDWPLHEIFLARYGGT